MSSPFRWLHYEQALPLLAKIDIPQVTKLYSVFKKAVPREMSIPEALEALGAEFFAEAMVLLQSLDPVIVRRLAAIASLSVEGLEEFVASPAKEAEVLAQVARMEAHEVIALVLFFTGVRLGSGNRAPDSSEGKGMQPETETSDSSEGPSPL